MAVVRDDERAGRVRTLNTDVDVVLRLLSLTITVGIGLGEGVCGTEARSVASSRGRRRRW